MRRLQVIFVWGFVVATSIGGVAAAAPATMTLADAVRIADAGMRDSATRGHPVAVVIVNGEGRVLLAERMDGAAFMSVDVAEAKARTAAATGVPTKALEALLAGGGTALLAVSGALPMAGGVPIILDGRIAGGIGISGGTPGDDDLTAVAANRALNSR